MKVVRTAPVSFTSEHQYSVISQYKDNKYFNDSNEMAITKILEDVGKPNDKVLFEIDKREKTVRAVFYKNGIKEFFATKHINYNNSDKKIFNQIISLCNKVADVFNRINHVL